MQGQRTQEWELDLTRKMGGKKWKRLLATFGYKLIRFSILFPK